jgi:hypothetical protein
VADLTPPLPGFEPGARRSRRPKRIRTERDRERDRLREQNRPKRHRPNRPPSIPRLVAKPCGWCGLSFETRNSRARYCSHLCSMAARQGAWPSSPLSWRECGWCGKQIRASYRTAFCSAMCRHRRHNWNAARKRGERFASDLGWAVCRQCGRKFSHLAKRCPEYCTDRCVASASQQRRKHRIRSNTSRTDNFTLREIAERDGWRCHICRRAVPERPYARRPKDPTMDHLVPISAGGQHVRENVALAHLICNTRRSTGGTAQLRLVG